MNSSIGKGLWTNVVVIALRRVLYSSLCTLTCLLICSPQRSPYPHVIDDKIEDQKLIKQLGQHLTDTECSCLGLTHSRLSSAWQCEERAHLCHSCQQETREACDGVFGSCSELLFHGHLQVAGFLFSPGGIRVQCVFITIKICEDY